MALKFMYLVIILLCLQVIKTFISRSEGEYAWFFSTVILATQFLLLVLVPLSILFRVLFRKRFPRHAAWLSWASALGMVVLFELLFTYWLHHPGQVPGILKSSYRYYYFQYDYHIAQFDNRLSTYDDQLYYTLKPGVRAHFANAEFRNEVAANRLGLRDDEASLSQPTIICVGDSYTWGWGVEQEQSFPQLIEKQTGRKVLNAGMASYGTAREIIGLSKVDLSKLEYLVVQYCGNDVTENKQFIREGNQLKISPEAEYRRLTRSHRNAMIYFPGKNFLLVGQIFLKKLVNKVYPVFSFEHLLVYDDEVNPDACKAFLDVLSRAPVDITKVTIVAFQLGPHPILTNRFARLTDSLVRTAPFDSLFKNNLQVIDMSRVVSRENFYELDPHLRPSGHMNVAQAIDSVLRR